MTRMLSCGLRRAVGRKIYHLFEVLRGVKCPFDEGDNRKGLARTGSTATYGGTSLLVAHEPCGVAAEYPGLRSVAIYELSRRLQHEFLTQSMNQLTSNSVWNVEPRQYMSHENGSRRLIPCGLGTCVGGSSVEDWRPGPSSKL